MHRLHLFEISDQRWCPDSVRETITDYMQFGIRMWKSDVEMAFLLRQVFKRLGTHKVIDLCSGSGGPWFSILKILGDVDLPTKICLTDKYPNWAAFKYLHDSSNGKLDFSLESVDAGCVPKSLAGFRTIFNGFHHFGSSEAFKILQDTVNCQQGIAIFEITDRTPWAIFNFMAVSLLMPFCVPFLRPFQWSRLVWTYLIPVAPIVQLFDSFVSCCRTYSVSELQRMTKKINTTVYTWEIGKIKPSHAPVPITYLLGYPSNT